NEAKAFEPLLLNYDRYREIETYVNTQLKPLQVDRLKSVLNLIQGFESTYALELLASVDYASKQEGNTTIEKVKNYLKNWNQRKANLFATEHVETAFSHLKEYQLALSF